MGLRLFTFFCLTSVAWGSTCEQTYVAAGPGAASATAAVAASPKRNPLPPLDEMIRKAGFTPEQVELLRQNSAGLMDAEEFLKIRDKLGKGFLLAKDDNARYTHQFFSSNQGLQHWYDGYDRMGMKYRWKEAGPINTHTPEYLGKITNTGEPIVFLVNDDLMNGAEGITRAEIRWLLEHPDKLKNVRFVFGAYDLVPDSVTKDFGRTRNWDQIREVLKP